MGKTNESLGSTIIQFVVRSIFGGTLVPLNIIVIPKKRLTWNDLIIIPAVSQTNPKSREPMVRYPNQTHDMRLGDGKGTFPG